MTLYLRPLLDDLSIKTTSLEIRKFDLDYVDPDASIGDWGWAQRPYIAEIERQYNAGKPVRIIVLKARQLGISTATEAVLFLWAFLHPGMNGMVVSHEDKQAQELYEMTRLYWDTWPHKLLFDERYKTRRQLRWTDTGSQIRVATAKNPEGLRGSTMHALHGSEVAYWPDPGTLWTGMNNTIPRRHGTIVVLESTANGVGNWWHEKWQEAEDGESEYIPMFFPWYFHSAYRLPNSLTINDLDPEEKDLLRLMGDPIDFTRGVVPGNPIYPGLSQDESLAALAWRRLEIPAQGGIEKFHQEFPSSPEEAFVTSGHPIFSANRIKECYIPRTGATGRLFKDGTGRVQFDEDSSGPLTIFKLPNPSDRRPDRYFVSGDPTRTTEGDYACIQVINRETFEQMAVWHGRIDAIRFAREMRLVGDFYHHAMLCPEVEGGGAATIGALIESGYGNIYLHHRHDSPTESKQSYGWSSNYQRKMWAIARLQNLILDRSLTLHDKLTVNELLCYVEHPDGTFGNSGRRTHDDTVMALAIGIAASIVTGRFDSSAPPRSIPDIFTSELEQPDNIIPIRKVR
jgi:hypothetical protein